MRSAFWLLLFGLLLTHTAGAQTYFPVMTLIDTARFAPYVAQTAYWLHAQPSPREVRVLVYGQSISMQDWWEEVKRFLLEKYPKARIVMENRAIGGFSTDRLKWMVENDVVSFNPDLILLHDYGGESDYEQIIRTIRSRTTAEIAVQTDHVGVGQNQTWHDQHNGIWLPDLCKRYGLALLDVRSAWKKYLEKNQLPAQSLLSDNVHLNAHGNYLMAEIIKQYLGALPKQSSRMGTVKEWQAERDFRVRQQELAISFKGTRVDLFWTSPPASSGERVEVRIDGKKPSQRTDCYGYTRPAFQSDGFFLTHIGQLLAMELGDGMREETWALTVTSVDTVRQVLNFAVRGSLTGADGAGRSDSMFTSRSGRIRIKPEGWFLRKSPEDFGQFRWLQPGDVLQWQVVLRCPDTVTPASVVTGLHGIAPGQHQLQLRGRALSRLTRIDVYQPPLPE